MFLAITSTYAYNLFFQGFEVDTSDVFDINSTDAWYGEVTRVPSGTNGITSFAGSYHAIFEGDADSGPFTRFDGYRDTWDGTWIAEVSVYLNPSWPAGTGFDYSVAATGSDSNHQRDYIFHITKDTSTGNLLVAGSNNTNFAPREDLENIDHYVVTEAGWYTLQHVFYEDSGLLAVDLNLLDDGGSLLFTETRTSAQDVIATEIGGNRYGWFTFINVEDGIAVDNLLLRNEAQYPRSAEITSPEQNAEVSGLVTFEAYLNDEEGDDSVQWAVRKGTCSAGQGTVFGNVDGFHNDYDWDGMNFEATTDVTGWEGGSYCFVFNPTESTDDAPIRLTREFMVLDTNAPIVTIESPEHNDVVSGLVTIFGTVEEDYLLSNYNISVYPGDADFRDFSLRLVSQTVYQDDGFNNESILEWDTTEWDDGEYLIRLAARDAEGNRSYDGDSWLGGDDSEHVIRVVVDNTPDLPTDPSECKKGGWESFGDMFKNQGDCVSYLNSNENAKGNRKDNQ